MSTEPAAAHPPDTSAKVIQTIEGAIATLKELGADHANACALLALQALYRLDGEKPDDLAAIELVAREATGQLDHYSGEDAGK